MSAKPSPCRDGVASNAAEGTNPSPDQPEEPVMHTTAQPGAPLVRRDGAILSIRRQDGRMAQFNRDDVTAAYLLLLDLPCTEEGAADVVVALMAEGLDRPEATRCLAAARLLLNHNIEP